METVHKTLRIVGIQQIEQYIVGLLHVHRVAVVNHVLKVFLFHRRIDEEIMDAAHERIVHDGVVFVPHQPLACVMPDLSQKIDIRFNGLHMIPDPFQEPVGHFISHIKTDAVDIIVPDPAFANVLEIADHGFAVRIEFRHLVRKSEGVIPSVLVLASLFSIVQSLTMNQSA